MIDINELRQALGAVQPEEVEELLDRLEAAESARRDDYQNWMTALDRNAELLAKLEVAEKERDGLRAKIEQMERQEPVATIHINSITGNPSVDFIPGHCYLHHNSSLYALPGAKGEEE